MAVVLVAAVLATLFAGPVRAHVALTFPPARKYALDFLDNVRTRPPCGMPRGDIVTTFPMGALLNVTWHMAYAHLGGFKLELLDRNDKYLMDLTPTTPKLPFVGENAITTQHAAVHLPAGLSCHGCTIRLLRQALDWGPHFLLWSCADIDVVEVQDFGQICSGRGIIDPQGLCSCNRPYSGSVCQFEDECWDDGDCGPYGRCVDTGELHFPRKQCYCSLGWHGPHCALESSVKSPNIDINLYTRRELSPDYHLFYRIIQESAELEVVLHSKGTSYLGLGWRPHGISISCKTFPGILERRPTPRLLEDDDVELLDREGVVKDTSSSAPGINHTKGTGPLESSNDTTTHRVSYDDELLAQETATTASLERESVVSTPSPKDSSTGGAASQNESTSPASPGNGRIKKRQITAVEAPDLSFGGNVTNSAAIPLSREVKSEQAEREGKRTNVIIHKYPPPSPYTPKADFHPMDCCDMVIGTARGNISRVRDYYTRDRSTPKPDEEYGGSNDLTAALGFEINGKTTILFRRKLRATELSDHPILQGPMEVIWARGQEPNTHRPSPNAPPAGDFYRPDQLKYHGLGSQRGKLVMNFFDEKRPTPPPPPTQAPSECEGEWSYPPGCPPSKCQYRAAWRYRIPTEEVAFTVTTTHSESWTGIGFSLDPRMPNSDAVIGWVDHVGRPVLLDTWLGGYAPPILDQSQDIYNISGSRRDGRTTLSFVRRSTTLDVDRDVHLTTQCPHFLFPVRGGSFNAVSKKIGKHLNTPVISEKPICVHACALKSNKPSATSTESQAGKTPAKEELEANFSAKTTLPTTIAFTPTSRSTSSQVTKASPPPMESQPEPSPCRGEWADPVGCLDPEMCNYKVQWVYRDHTDDVVFTITTRTFNKWTGIGFSKNRIMPETDAVIGWVLDSGRFFLMDTWLEGHASPLLDPQQNIYNESGWRENGVTTLQFARKRTTGDSDRDLDLADCVYLVFPVRGGVYNAVSKKIRQHEQPPAVSSSPICFSSCSPATPGRTTASLPTSIAVAKPPEVTVSKTSSPSPTTIPTTSPVTTTAVLSLPSYHTYTVHLKLTEIDNFASLSPDDALVQNVEEAFKEVKGYKSAAIRDVERLDGESASLIQMDVVVQSSQDSEQAMRELEESLQSLVRQGRIGALAVDPSFLRVSPVSGDLPAPPAVIPSKPAQPKDVLEAGSSDGGITDEQLKTYLIIGGVGLLLLLVVLQGVWMACSTRRRRAPGTAGPAAGPPVNGKEKTAISANSNWKDLSSYSYENFGLHTDSEMVAGSGSKRHLAPAFPAGSMSSLHSRHQQQSKDHMPPGSRASLPGYGSGGLSAPRYSSSTFERPGRGARDAPQSLYGTHDRGAATRAGARPQEARPDFYFMPHQRRYSGEVVRVFVDYTNPEYSP